MLVLSWVQINTNKKMYIFCYSYVISVQKLNQWSNSVP